jgi:hypothetical protein
MKKVIIIFCLCLIVTGFAAAQVGAGGTLYVSVKTLTLKSDTGFFAGNKGTLNYGDRVTVTKVDGKHVEVRSAADSSLIGWAAASNFTAKQIVSASSSTASAREVALAGKGFSQEVENSYNSQQTDLNYADVDKTEAITVSEDDLIKFLEEGRLRMGDN